MNLRSLGLRKIPIASRFKGWVGRTALGSMITVGTLLAAVSVSAQVASEGAALSMDQAIQLTLEQHPQLDVYLHRRNAYVGMVEQAGVGDRPTMGLMVEDFAGQEDRSNFDSAQSTLSINWVMQGGRIESRVKAAQAASDQVDIQREIEALDLSAQTARLFVQAVAEEQRLALAREAVNQAEASVAAIGERVEAGSSPEFERLQAEVETAQRELEAEDIQHGLGAARHKLSAQWGGGRSANLLIGDLSRIPTLEDVDGQFDLLKQNPALVLLATQKRIAESEIELARIEAKPQWQFSLGVRRYESTDDYGLVAGVSVPLGTDRKSTGRVKSLQAKQAEYAAESEVILRRLDAQLFVLLQEINHSRHVIATLKGRVIPALDSAQSQATRAYETGQLGYQQWIALVNKKLGAQQDLLNAYESIHLQHIELQRLTGTTLTF